jgi:hypothetical protein
VTRPAPRIPWLYDLSEVLHETSSEEPRRKQPSTYPGKFTSSGCPVSEVSHNLLFYVHNLQFIVLCSYLPAVFEDSLRSGYSTPVQTLDTGYYREPTLQIASYDACAQNDYQVHYDNSKGLSRCPSCGISDACNKYGESLVHRVCKAGNKKLLQVFLEHGASVQIANDYGRTPLHEVFITKPCFINFEQVLKQDPI